MAEGTSYARIRAEVTMGNNSSRTDQKQEGPQGSRDGKVNQYRPVSRGSVGSHKPGGDGPGTKKFKWEHDDQETRK
jgi:hypothetical protein